MKRLLILFLFLAPCCKAQSIGLPVAVGVHCTNPVTTCTYPIVVPGQMGIIHVVGGNGTTITDSTGDVWTKDFCTQYDNGNCIFHTNFSMAYQQVDVITFTSPTPVVDVFMFRYADKWNFSMANQGTYQTENSVFPDCVNGGNCRYNWTLPVEADAGDLIIAWSNANSSPHLPTPGHGYNLEANDSSFAVEDMLAPVDGTYIGSLVWRAIDGSEDGGSHWVMGIAVYTKGTP